MARNSESFRMALAALGSPSRLDTPISFSVSGAQAIATARARVAGSELLMSSALAFLARQASRASYDLSIFDVRLPSPVVLPHALSSRTRRTRAVRMQSLGLTLGRKAGLRRDYHLEVISTRVPRRQVRRHFIAVAPGILSGRLDAVTLGQLAG